MQRYLGGGLSFSRFVRIVGVSLGAATVALLVAFSGSSGAAAKDKEQAKNDAKEAPAYGLFRDERIETIPRQVNDPTGGVLRGPTNNQLAGTQTGKEAGKAPSSGRAATMSAAASPSPSPDALVSVGTMPTGVAANNTTAYVANAGSNTVSVIDLGTGAVTATIPVGLFPVGVALSPDNTQVYVTNYNGNSLSIISTASNTVTNTVPVGSRPNGVIRVGSTVYVANLTGNSVSVVNPGTATVTSTVTLGSNPNPIAPSGLATNGAGTRLYASDAKNGKFVVLNLTVSPPVVLTNSTVVGTFPAYIAVSGTRGYVTNPGSNTVSVLDLSVSPPAGIATVPVGTADYGVAVQQSLEQIFVTNSGSNTISVINGDSNTVGATFPTGIKPNAIVITPDGLTAVLTLQGDNKVSIRGINQAPLASVPPFSQSVNANGTGSANKLTFSTGNGNLISVEDPDAGTNPVRVTLSVSNGTLSLSGTAGLSFNSGANNSAAMDISGTLASINAALDGMQYTPTTGYVGPDTLTVTISDQGNTGIGLVGTAAETLSINVVNVAPVVNNVSYSGAVGNTIFGVGQTPAQPETHATGTVLSGSSDVNNDTLTAGPANITSTNGGTVTMNTNGTFTYVSAPGYNGNDTFTFTVSDGKGGSTNGTATVTVANRVWYVNNGLGVNGNGTSVSPFNTLANLRNGGDVDSPGDYIFLYQGSGNYTGGLPLENNQRLIGQPEGLVINSVTIVSAGGTNPTITNSGGVGIVLAQGNTIRRVNVTNTSSAGINGSGINTADIGPNMTISNSGGAGFSLFGGGSGNVTMAANVTHSNATGRSVFFGGRTGGTVNVTGSVTDTAGGVQLDTNTGTTINFTGGLTVSGATETFKATGGGTVTVTGTNTLSSTSGSALNVASTNIGAAGLTFQSINASGAANGIILNGTGNAGGLTVTGTGAAGSGGTIQNTTGDAISLTSVGAAVSLTNMATTNNALADVLVNGSGANVTYAGTITNQSGKGRSVVVQNRTGGTVLFSGDINDQGTGISLTSNTGGTINFTGGLTMSTGSNAAFTATGGGTVNVTGTNTIATTTGTALDIQNTTIGASNATFQSISANGGTNGIQLVNTGSSGRLIVTGTGSGFTGGTIQNITGADGATTGIGIRMDNTLNPSFSWMNLHDFGNFAIFGNAVNGLTLSRVTINGVNGNNAAIDEASVAFTQLSGSVSIINTTVQGGIEDNFRVVNSSGTLNRLTFDTVTIGANSTANGNDGISLEGTGGTFNVTVQSSTFTSARGDWFQLNALGTVASDLIFQNNTLTNNHPAIVGGGGGMTVAVGSSGDLTYDINNNTMRDSKGSAIVVNKAFGGAPGDGTAVGKIRNNTIGVSGTANSGSSEGSGIHVGVLARGLHTTLIQNNTIRRYSNDGILVQAGGSAQSVTGVTHDAALNATIQGNTIAEPNAPGGGLAQNGIRLNAGTNSGGGNDAYSVCLSMGDPSVAALRNTLTGSEALGGASYRLQVRFATTVRLPGYTGAANGSGLNAYLTPRTNGSFTDNTTASGTGSYVNTTGGAACPVPA